MDLHAGKAYCHKYLYTCVRMPCIYLVRIVDSEIFFLVNLQSNQDIFDWTRHKGATTSVASGPPFDHTLGNENGYYMYIETSDNEPGDFAWLTSAMGPSTRGSCLHFWQV